MKMTNCLENLFILFASAAFVLLFAKAIANSNSENTEWHKLFVIWPRRLGTFNPDTYKFEGKDAGKFAFLKTIERRSTGWSTGRDGETIFEHRLLGHTNGNQ